jgi:biopolymer transport protein ExbD
VRLSSRKSGASVEMQMTSMIDVTFLLLIFFMATSGFVIAERELDPRLVVDQPSATRSTSRMEPAIIDIVPSGGGFVYKLGGREFKTTAELGSVLRKLENKGDGAVVRGDDRAPFDMAPAAIQACKDAGFINVRYGGRRRS